MKEFNLKFNEQQLQIILNALGDVPYKFSAGVLQEIGNQVAAAHAAANAPVEDKAEDATE